MSTPKPLRVLLLHGYTQSGPLFRSKTRALEKSLHKLLKSAYSAHFTALDFVYPTAPVRIRPADIPGFLTSSADSTASKDGHGDEDESAVSECYGWWVRRGDAEPFTYEGIEEGLGAVARELKQAVKEGRPFDGVLGFSQGGALAGMVAALLEGGRREAFERLSGAGGMSWPAAFDAEDSGMIEEVCHPPMRFAVSYSGFGATTNKLYMPFYEPKIATPMLHFLGSVDTVVEEERSLRLVRSCKDGAVGRGGRSRVVRHPGGHFLPSSGKPYVGALAEFIGECMEWEGQRGGKEEEKAEDMDVPF